MWNLELYFKQAKYNPFFLPGQSSFLCFLLVHLLYKFNFSHRFFLSSKEEYFLQELDLCEFMSHKTQYGFWNKLRNFVMLVSHYLLYLYISSFIYYLFYSRIVQSFLEEILTVIVFWLLHCSFRKCHSKWDNFFPVYVWSPF